MLGNICAQDVRNINALINVMNARITGTGDTESDVIDRFIKLKDDDFKLMFGELSSNELSTMRCFLHRAIVSGL